uniref:AB hydrolase-1 domain-containing protein n=1 Tax=Xiphophorus couchianus TaxID=32473 RepID=A0A3B5LMN6_9TELE
MAAKKAVLFNFWGVVVPSRPAGVFHKLEELHNLPRGFLSSVASQSEGALIQAERGQVTLNQMIPTFKAECAKQAEVRGVEPPSDWCVGRLLEEVRTATMDVRDIVLKTSASLRYHGVLTAVLANHWLDDSASGDRPARLLCLLGSNFDLVLQSCRSGHRVPEVAMFNSALDQLGIPSQQALWLDVDQESVKAAEKAGMEAVLVENLEVALRKLAHFTGVQAVGAESRPITCCPDQVSHGYVTLRPGVRTHYVEMGSGPPVLLCHGFPESWYSWRYQIPALAAAGFRVLALDMKGYGESTAPPEFNLVTFTHFCLQDLISFMDKMVTCPSGPPSPFHRSPWWVTTGAAPWFGLCHIWKAVASLNTPLFPPDPSKPASEKLKALPAFDYQIYFQKPGVAEAELENDLERTFNIFFSSGREVRTSASGLFVGLPQQIPRSSMLTEADLRYYVGRFRGSGFRGPLNWYRNNQANWKWMCSQPTGKVGDRLEQLESLLLHTDDLQADRKLGHTHTAALLR